MDQDKLERIKEGLRNDPRFTEDEIQNVRIIQEHSDGSIDVRVPMTTKAFIERVLIREMQEVVRISPWIGFIAMSSAIEFLGKCVDSENPLNWNKPGRSRKDFEAAISQLDGLTRYACLIPPSGLAKAEKISGAHFDIYGELRCGLLHAFAPTSRITLSHGEHEQKTVIDKNGIVNFNATELYEEFSKACKDVISREYPSPNKMNEPKLGVNCRLIPQ